MFKNYFKTAFRNLSKNKMYAVINGIGLTVGLTACLLIGIYIINEQGYDKFNKNAGRIVRATMEYQAAGTVNTTATTGTKVGPQFKRMFPLVEEYVRTFISHSIIKKEDKIFDEPKILYADPAFFKVFSFRFIEGDPLTALDAPDKIVLTQAMSKKYFGDESALNKTLQSGKKVLKVSGVCEDVPLNSQIKFDFVTQFLNLGNNASQEIWWSANWITYFLLRDEKSLPVFQQQVKSYMNSSAVRTEAGLEGNDYLTYNLEPLLKVHLYSSLAGFEPNGSMSYVYMFGLIALLILVIACANYTNLATAQSTGRTAEIGMRKVMGASRPQVFMQFIGESSLITFLAAILALVLSILLVPYFNNVTGKVFTTAMLLQPLPVIALLLCAVFVSFFAGLYPALVLAGAQTMGVLKQGFNFTGGTNLLRKTLIVAQFAISVFLIIYAVVIMQQMHYMQNRNLGYDKDHVIVLPIGGSMVQDFANSKNAIALVPGVEGVTASYETPEYVQWGDNISAIDEKGKHEISLNAMPVDLDFIKTLKMQLIAGRDFQQSDFAMLDTANNNANYRQPYIINETLAKKIGWSPQQAINKVIEKSASGPVVGVVKDFNFSSLHDSIGPLLIFLGRDYSRDFLVRINSKNESQTLASLGNLWKTRVPDRLFNFHFLDDDYNKLHLAEERTAKLFSVAAGIAMILACLGLFGLAAFTTAQRAKEVGIRKILGATIASITLLIARNFLQLVALAILIAIPLAWWAGHQWLQDFAFRVHISWIIFVMVGVIAILIALITVSLQAIKAAIANPVKSLRTE